jgi:ATP-dependent RNA helicase DDX31/DBP7
MVVDDDDGGGGLTLNIAGASSDDDDNRNDDFRAPKGNPRKRTVARGKKKWQGGKEKRKAFPHQRRREGEDDDREQQQQQRQRGGRIREPTHPRISSSPAERDEDDYKLAAAAAAAARDDGGGGEETPRRNGRKRLAKTILAGGDGAGGASAWVKKPKTKRTTNRGEDDGEEEEEKKKDDNDEDKHLTAKERFLKNSREHKEKLLAAKKKANGTADDELEIEKKKRKEDKDDENDDESEEEAFNPADWANLMKKATKKEESDDDDEEENKNGGNKNKKTDIGAVKKKEAAPHRDRVFDSNATTAKSFAELGVPETLIKIMAESVDLQFTTPTLVQQLAVPSILAGKDCYVRAETGSGKTLAYALPIVISLGVAKPRIDRKDGTRALIIVPTRELSTQVSSFIEKLSKPYHWIATGSIHGGENRAKEKAKLRKGCVILSATPGRLLDHLQNTASFVYVNVGFVVFDEADRVLDLGFEKDIDAILDIIERTKKEARAATASPPFLQMTLLSATLTPGTDRLRMKMQNAVTVDVNPEADREIEFVQEEDDNENDEDEEGLMRAMARASGRAVDGDDDGKNKKIRVPSQLTHTIFETPPKCRMAAIAGLLAGWAMSDLNKVIVFFASRESVEYHYEILSWLAGQKNNGDDDERNDNSSSSTSSSSSSSSSGSTSGESDSDDDDSKNKKKKSSGTKKRGSGLYEVFRLHGAQKQSERQKTVSRFQSQERGVLLCTDVGARGLDFDNVGATVQVDPPADSKTYAHRVGRAARLGNDGEAVLFLGPKELEFENALKEDIEDLTFSKAKLGAVLDVLAQTTMQKYCGDNKNPSNYSRNNPTEHIAVKALLSAAERKMHSDPGLKSRAEDAFRSHVRAVAAYPSALKHIFHVKRLHLGHVAGAFALREAPTLVGKKGSTAFSNAKKLDKVTSERKKREKESQKRKKRALKKLATNPSKRGDMPVGGQF